MVETAAEVYIQLPGYKLDKENRFNVVGGEGAGISVGWSPRSYRLRTPGGLTF